MGGVNARSQAKRFLDLGVNLICNSEAEQTIIDIGNAIAANKSDFTAVPGVMFLKEGRVVSTRPAQALIDLDELPVPAWDLLPLDLYWRIARPHGGGFTEGEHVKYASMMTSRGCPFSCQYCHISVEKQPGSITGSIGKFRTKSIGRVLEEIDVL